MGEETARLREEIDRTRADLTRDVDMITDRTSPARIARRRWERARSAGTSMKERVMGSDLGHGSVQGTAQSAVGSVQGTAQSAVGSAQGTARSAVDTTRRTAEGNPLAAGMVAFGVGWLVSSLVPASEAERRAAITARDTAREHADVVQPLVDQAKQGAHEVGQHMKDQAAGSVEGVREHAREAAATVAEEGQHAGHQVAGEARSAGQDVTEQARASGQQVRPGSGAGGD